MDRWFEQRAQRDAAAHGQCFECHEHLSSRLLWPVQAKIEDEQQTVLLCFACVAVEMLRMLAGTLEATPAPAEAHRCERCRRRSRATHDVHGFQVCGECSGEEA